MPIHRRQVLGAGFAALALGSARAFGARMGAPPGRGRLRDPGALGDPRLALTDLGATVRVGGLPFAPWFTGDDFPDPESVPFHYLGGGPLPAPQERVDVAIVGGGLSGLATAYMLRERRPVLFDLRPRFGGNALGETWREARYSLGSAYVITPDRGSFLERLYTSLGLTSVQRTSAPPDPVEVGGVVRSDFWSGAGTSPEEARVFRRYAEVVTAMAEERYPEIPLAQDVAEADAVRRLDLLQFREDLEQQMGVALTPRLAAAVQGYFYSSFGAGMEEISAAAGWNFLAAEEYGRLVFPGGNSALAGALWDGLRESALSGGEPQRLLRPGCRVVDVRRDGHSYRVTWIDQQGAPRALLARQVVMAGAKQIVKHVLQDVATKDPRKMAAMNAVETMPYVVANVLLDAPVQRDFYDLFLVGDELAFPMTPGAFEAASRPVDIVNGNYALASGTPRSALTFYWPLPWFTARFSLLVNDPWERYSAASVDTVRHGLALLGVADSAVRQVRLTRWGHAMPLARPRFIAGGHAEALVRPFDGAVHFVNQDNWALPAVENSLLDAAATATRVLEALA
ncbi:MAG: NAD(P)-binding protein [Planctomycetota bacterium]